ncbi:MAG: hypothetical protein WBV73_17035 [Phormidium sp.]
MKLKSYLIKEKAIRNSSTLRDTANATLRERIFQQTSTSGEGKTTN